MDSKIIVVWHGHSCFTLSADGYTLALDPYDNSLDGYAPLQLSANEILCSHGHHDHAWLPAVTLLDTPASSPFQVLAMTARDDRGNGLLEQLRRESVWIRIYRKL